jgi:hypothetical protein
VEKGEDRGMREREIDKERRRKVGIVKEKEEERGESENWER